MNVTLVVDPQATERNCALIPMARPADNAEKPPRQWDNIR